MVARPCRRRRPSSLDDGGISGFEWLDEGRMEVAENPAREIDPEKVKGDKPGSGFAPDFLPEFSLI